MGHRVCHTGGATDWGISDMKTAVRFLLAWPPSRCMAHTHPLPAKRSLVMHKMETPLVCSLWPAGPSHTKDLRRQK
jgi:hypothetical protein